MSTPNFHFLDPLNQIPGTELDTLLGRFVLNRWNPLVHGYEPRDPSTIITPEFISEDMHFGNAEMYITAIQHASANVAARKALTVRGSRTREGDVQLSSVQVTKRGLRHAPAAFDALMADEDVAASVRKMMRSAGAHRVWMITAVLFASDAHVKTNASRSTDTDVTATVQIPGGATGGPDVNVAKMSASRQKMSGAGLEADLTGCRVVAVQYWRCEDPRFFGRLRGKMSLRGKGLEKVDTGYRGLGDSEEEDGSSDDDEAPPPLVLGQCEEVPGDAYEKASSE